MRHIQTSNLKNEVTNFTRPPQNHPKIGKYVFFEILCLFEFVCFQIFDFWIQNAICGCAHLGFYRIWRFRCCKSKKRTILVLRFRPLNFNVKTRRWRKMTTHSLQMPLQLSCSQEFLYNFSRWCKGHMWFKLERRIKIVLISWQNFSKKSKKQKFLLSKIIFSQKPQF